MYTGAISLKQFLQRRCQLLKFEAQPTRCFSVKKKSTIGFHRSVSHREEVVQSSSRQLTEYSSDIVEEYTRVSSVQDDFEWNAVASF